MNWSVIPKNIELSGKALLTQKLSNVMQRLNSCEKIHDFWNTDMLISKSELENIAAEFRFDLQTSGVAKLAASGAAISTAISKINSNAPKAIRFVHAASANVKDVIAALEGVDPSEAVTLELGMDDWAEQLAKARSQLPAGISWHLD